MDPRIEICMGSSCWARGNEQLLPLIESFLAERELDVTVDLVGLRCGNRCSEGPNIRINGILYPHQDPGQLRDLLEEHFGTAKESAHG